MDKGTAYYHDYQGFNNFYPNADDNASYTFSEGCVKPYKGLYTDSKPVHAYFEIYTDGTVASKHIGADNEPYSTEGICRVMKKFEKSVSIQDGNVTLLYIDDSTFYEEASDTYYSVILYQICYRMRTYFSETGFTTPLEFEIYNNNFILESTSAAYPTGLCSIDATYKLIEDYQQ